MEEMEAEAPKSELRLHMLISGLLRTGEAERRRISRELHDGLGQTLSILKLRIGFLARRLSDDQSELRRGFEETLEDLAGIIESTRKLSHELSPSILADLGLGTALRRLVSQFEHLGVCSVESRIEGVDRLLPMESEINLYRILQESLGNIEHHARARNVAIRVERIGECLVSVVEDDGRGFDWKGADASDDRGMGLAIMRERARMMGAVMELQSRIGKGTRIRLSVPLEGRRHENKRVPVAAGR